jgi:hypothetical protein
VISIKLNSSNNEQKISEEMMILYLLNIENRAKIFSRFSIVVVVVVKIPTMLITI